MRISKNTCIGIDPGAKGAIVLSIQGKASEVWSFDSRIQRHGINQLMCVDPIWLQNTLNVLRQASNRLTLETPKLIAYGGKVKIATICQLQQQVAQIHHAAIVAGFEVVCADPQNWQGYHGLFASGSKTVKTVVVDAFREWHRENDPNNPLIKKSDSALSGIADAWAIANYAYQQPVEKSVKERRKTIVQPPLNTDFAFF